MNNLEIGIAIAMIVIYLLAFALFHLLIFRVNRRLPQDRRIPHSLYRGDWNRLATEYKASYPEGNLYSLTLLSTILFFALALATVVLRVLDNVHRP